VHFRLYLLLVLVAVVTRHGLPIVDNTDALPLPSSRLHMTTGYFAVRSPAFTGSLLLTRTAVTLLAFGQRCDVARTATRSDRFCSTNTMTCALLAPPLPSRLKRPFPSYRYHLLLWCTIVLDWHACATPFGVTTRSLPLILPCFAFLLQFCRFILIRPLVLLYICLIERLNVLLCGGGVVR